jgi:hypothetical protein
VRFTLSKTPPTQKKSGRGFAVVTSVLGDTFNRVITNAINDPEYIQKEN